MNTFHGTNEIIDWLNLISHNNNLLPLLGSFCHGEAWSHFWFNYTGDQNGLIARLLVLIPEMTGELTNQLRGLMTANVSPYPIHNIIELPPSGVHPTQILMDEGHLFDEVTHRE